MVREVAEPPVVATGGEGLLRAALGATGDGIGCHHRLRAEVRLGVETLAALGLVKPIRQRIPACSEHACPLREGCRFARAFAEGTAGRSGKKFRLSPLGARRGIARPQSARPGLLTSSLLAYNEGSGRVSPSPGVS